MDRNNGFHFLLVFCICLGPLPTTAISCSALVEQVLVPGNTTSLAVEVCTGVHVTWMTIVDKNLTWFESIALCKDMGFSAADKALPQWARRTQVRKYLENVDYKSLNYTFWTGLFRSFNQENKWYSGLENCRKFPDSVDVDYMMEGLCVAIERNETSSYKESLFVDNCNNRHPVVCTKFNDNSTYLAYSGFDIPSISITTDIRPTILTNVSCEFCKDKCHYKGGCTAFTYYYDINNCTLFEMAFANDNNNYFNYTIEESTQNVTHYAKAGCQLNFTAANITVPSNIATTIPDCRNDEMEVYCQCNGSESTLTETEIETIVNELVANLTVDPKATSANRRKLTSAEDSRQESKVVGTFGIIFMAVIFSLPVIADCFLPSFKVKKKLK